ncbi:MAG TPA: protein-glutamate O-methyltransferase CheR [Allosphingosinicella sp.]|nr:protein-glutamate O-methyltransferase CheR [Allosphingosinicella sp.]
MSRRWRIETALKVVMQEHRIATLDELIANLVTGREPSLAAEVVDALLNNETFFFRDRAPFDLLLNRALRRFERTRAREKKLAIWCAGCATGQEVYSIAMSIAEERSRWQGWSIDILGTDISHGAIARASEGLYSQFEVQRGLSVLQMMRWFNKESASQWRIADSLKDAVRFEVHSLRDAVPSPGTFDVILCRNVLLYFAPEARKLAFERLAAASAPDACLMLGAAETVIGHTHDFVPDKELRGLYVRVPPATELPLSEAAPRAAAG